MGVFAAAVLLLATPADARRVKRGGAKNPVRQAACVAECDTVRNLIYMIGDGMGLAHVTMLQIAEGYDNPVSFMRAENVALIKSIPKDTLSEMQGIVSQGFQTGATLTSIEKEIRNTYHVKRSSAKLLARDQIAKLNGELTKQQQTDAGVEEYIWSDSGDGRVRESHHALNGKRFRWDDPPVVTPPGKPVRRCHPGQDYQCRCVALPVFDISTVDIPASGRTKGGG